jgi:hypothetical protein
MSATTITAQTATTAAKRSFRRRYSVARGNTLQATGVFGVSRHRCGQGESRITWLSRGFGSARNCWDLWAGT